MKHDRIKLAQWQGSTGDQYVDIPWPQVHAQASSAAIDWLNRQDSTHCQLMLETVNQFQSLWAEFYNSTVFAEYTEKFGK